MNTQHYANAPYRFPFYELEQIESIIDAQSKLLTTLDARRVALLDELERITRPLPQLPNAKVPRFGPGFEYRGNFVTRSSFIDVHIDLLTRLWNDHADQREVMAKAVAARGRSRTYVDVSPQALFTGGRQDWIVKHSRPLVAGWYIDTNLSKLQITKILRSAAEAGGLEWGKDVVVHLNRSLVPN